MYFDISKRRRQRLVRAHPEWEDYEPSRNIYEKEDALFRQMHRKKAPEPKIDRLIHGFLSVVFIVVAALIAAGGVRLPEGLDGLKNYLSIPLAGLAALFLVSTRFIRRRTWR